jgi:hypothetical protein
MNLRAGLVVIAFAALLGGCEDVTLFGDDSSDSTAPMANGCTAQGCPQAPQFCQARGYTPGTDGYERCLVSVEQNLRKGQ